MKPINVLFRPILALLLLFPILPLHAQFAVETDAKNNFDCFKQNVNNTYDFRLSVKVTLVREAFYNNLRLELSMQSANNVSSLLLLSNSTNMISPYLYSSFFDLSPEKNVARIIVTGTIHTNQVLSSAFVGVRVFEKKDEPGSPPHATFELELCNQEQEAIIDVSSQTNLFEHLEKPVIWPNPASQTLHLQRPAATSHSQCLVEIVDLLGRTVASTRMEQGELRLDWPLANLANGMYVVKFNGQSNHRSMILISD